MQGLTLIVHFRVGHSLANKTYRIAG